MPSEVLVSVHEKRACFIEVDSALTKSHVNTSLLIWYDMALTSRHNGKHVD